MRRMWSASPRAWDERRAHKPYATLNLHVSDRDRLRPPRHRGSDCVDSTHSLGRQVDLHAGAVLTYTARRNNRRDGIKPCFCPAIDAPCRRSQSPQAAEGEDAATVCRFDTPCRTTGVRMMDHFLAHNTIEQPRILPRPLLSYVFRLAQFVAVRRVCRLDSVPRSNAFEDRSSRFSRTSNTDSNR